MSKLWGIDLGGTKIEGVVVEEDNPSVALARLRTDTEAGQGYDHILQRIEGLLANISKQVGASPKALGIGTPGALNPDTLCIKNSNTTCLIGRPLKNDLEHRLGIPCFFSNDANCFALAEATLGAGRNSKVCFGVIMGTGVGGGIVVDGKVLNGKHGITGEWGHNVLHSDGPLCYCGKRGCVETFLRGPALEEAYSSLSGKNLKLKDIVLHANSGDTHAEMLVAKMCQDFGLAMSMVVNILDPDVIVLGGGVSNIDLLYTKGAEALGRSIFNADSKFETRVVRHSLGDSAGVFGAALLSKGML